MKQGPPVVAGSADPAHEGLPARAEVLARAAAVGRWEALYHDVRRRRAAGQSLREINRKTDLARATVRKYAFADRFPRHGLRGPELSILDPYLDHLHARLDASCQNAMQLWRVLCALGFPGTPKQVGRWLSERRTRPASTTARQWQTAPTVAVGTPLSPPPLPLPKQLSWCLLSEPEDARLVLAAITWHMRDRGASRRSSLAFRPGARSTVGFGAGWNCSVLVDTDETFACSIF